MKLSDIRGEEAIEALADLIDPLTEILGDNEVGLALRNKNNLFAVKHALKNHKKAVITMLAILDGEDPNTYSPSILTLPVKLLEVFNDKELGILFQSQGQMKTSSGSAMGNTQDHAE